MSNPFSASGARRQAAVKDPLDGNVGDIAVGAAAEQALEKGGDWLKKLGRDAKRYAGDAFSPKGFKYIPKRAALGAGMIAAPLALLEFADDEDPFLRNALEVAGTGVGGLAGGAVGSVFGPAGSFIGGTTGAAGGKALMANIYDSVMGESEADRARKEAEKTAATQEAIKDRAARAEIQRQMELAELARRNRYKDGILQQELDNEAAFVDSLNQGLLIQQANANQQLAIAAQLLNS